MARIKRSSDELYNARRRVRRAADRLERAGNEAGARALRELAVTGGSASIQELNAAYDSLRGAERQVRATVGMASRPKRASDELYNARRRLRRQAARLEREALAQTGRAREMAESFAQYLRSEAEASRIGRKKISAEQRGKLLERLANIRKATRGASTLESSVGRHNLIFMQQMNAAGMKGASSSITHTESKVFWVATKGLWPRGTDVPRNQRYEMILEHFYASDTTDAREFRAWVEKKGLRIEDHYGDLQLVFEYITTELNDADALSEQSENDYEVYKGKVITLR